MQLPPFYFYPSFLDARALFYTLLTPSSRVFTSIAKTQLNVDSSTPTSDTVRGYISSNISTITPEHNFNSLMADTYRNRMSNFEQRLQHSIQTDLERMNSSYYQNVNSIKVKETSFNATELCDSDRLDLLSNTLWSSSNTLSHMELALQNSGHVLTSHPQVLDLISI